MLPFIYAGVVSTIGALMGRRLAEAHHRRRASKADRLPTTSSVRILAHHLLAETTLTLATEDVPMDNRFGNKPMSSEHEFSQTATISLELGDSHRVAAGAKTTLWNLLESKAEMEIGKNLGVEVGSQINRRVRLRFATDPGQFVRYRVVWQQQSRRGVLEIQAGRHIFQLPYLIAYGLSHTVESLPGESIAKRPKPGHQPDDETAEEESA
ncbi:MAG: hypothetical protein H7838_12790 [Magnetococcus sp. DMHC-8]